MLSNEMKWNESEARAWVESEQAIVMMIFYISYQKKQWQQQQQHQRVRVLKQVLMMILE